MIYEGEASLHANSTISAASSNYVHGSLSFRGRSTVLGVSVNSVPATVGVKCSSTITASGGRSWSEIAAGGVLVSSPNVVSTVTFGAICQAKDSTSISAKAKVLHVARAIVSPRISIVAAAAVNHVGVSVMVVKLNMIAEAINYVPGVSAMGSQDSLVILTSLGNVINHPSARGGVVIDAPLPGCPYETFSSFGRFDSIDFGL